MTVMRAGVRRELTVTPAIASDADLTRWLFNSTGAGNARVERALRDVPPSRVNPDIVLFGARTTGRLGVRVQNLAGDLNEYFGVDGGALVTQVTAGSPAAAAGLRPGDVITAWNGAAVETSADLSRRAAAASGSVELTVVREREERTITVDLTTRQAPVVMRRYGV